MCIYCHNVECRYSECCYKFEGCLMWVKWQYCLSNVTERAVHEMASKLNVDMGRLEENFK
jgi:hypothetical protein